MASNLSLKGGLPVRTKPFVKWPIFDNRERELLLDVLESGCWSFNGPVEEAFAKRFATFCGAEEVWEH